jgi:DNA-binding MarR family transcriptional regulator
MDQYVPALITWLANKLSASASSLYLQTFGVGIIEWRIMATLALEPEISGARICQVVGLDKAAVSRGFLKLSKAGLIEWRGTERSRLAMLSAAGRQLHDRIVPVALERERLLLDGLTEDQKALLTSTLHRLLNNLSLVNDFKPEGR